ncbi:MAG TPA: thiamine diphosphokinase [Candidatus Cloacimonadota bacterium]|nr:thiamine diphosphokinase [Candidatus Cloacimonadota bacterium]
MKPPSKAWLITPQAPPESWKGYQGISPEDLIIAVDGGLKRCLELAWEPHYLCGDLDSVDEGLIASYPTGQIWRFPREKNETDTELALRKCMELGIRDLLICNDLSGRADHALGLVQNLLLAHKQGLQAKILTGGQELFFLPPLWEITGRKGCLLSLIAWEGEARFEASEGLKWDLSGLALRTELSRGISNEITSETVSIRLASGLALAVLTEIG